MIKDNKPTISIRFVITGKPRREEIWEYPLDAIREAVINAIVHRDYTEPSEIQIRIYDNKLIVWSPGKLPLGITLDDLYRLHKSVLRNKLIAQIFFDVGLIERWGTGISRIIELCKKQNLPMPIFEEYQGFRVIFRKPFAREELAKLNLNDRQRTATRDLTDLVKRGFFEIVGKGKRELKYKLLLRNVPKMSQKMSQNEYE